MTLIPTAPPAVALSNAATATVSNVSKSGGKQNAGPSTTALRGKRTQKASAPSNYEYVPISGTKISGSSVIPSEQRPTKKYRVAGPPPIQDPSSSSHPHSYPPAVRSAKPPTHTRLSTPKPKMEIPKHVSLTNPIKEITGNGKQRDTIYVTRKTGLGCYLRRCKGILVDQGMNHLTLYALSASIPHALLILHALLDILPYPKQYVRYELRTGSIDCVDEMIPEGTDDEGKGTLGDVRGDEGDDGSGKDTAMSEKTAEKIPTTAAEADVEAKADAEADAEVNAEPEPEPEGTAEDGEDMVDEEEEDRLLKEMVTNGVHSVEEPESSFRTRTKSTLEIVIRIGKPSNPILPKPNPTTSVNIHIPGTLASIKPAAPKPKPSTKTKPKAKTDTITNANTNKPSRPNRRRRLALRHKGALNNARMAEQKKSGGIETGDGGTEIDEEEMMNMG